MDNENDFTKEENIDNTPLSEDDNTPNTDDTSVGEENAQTNETAGGMNPDGTYSYKNLGGTRVYQSNPDKPYTPPQPNAQYSYSSYSGYTPPQPEKKKKNSSVTVAVICILIVVVLLFSAVAFALGRYVANNAGGTETLTQDTLPTIYDDTDVDAVKPADTTRSDVTLPYEQDTVVPGMDTKVVAAKTVNSVVEIRTEAVVTSQFMGQYVTEGAGSGVIISADGFIATNHHVIEGATKITVNLRNGDSYEATLWGYDIKNDLAVVKIEAQGLQAAIFGNSDNLVVAEEVLAIGNPLGELGGSVSRGIISALSREVTVENQTMTLLQTDASVNPGNSGGGLFNASGELIGIVNAKSSGEGIEGIGFAIPSNTAYPILQDIISNQTTSKKASLGVTVGYDARYGVYISEIVPGSDAERSGLQVNDIILYVDDMRITSSSQLVSVVGSYYVGDTATFVVYRGRNTETVAVEFTNNAE